VPSYYTTAKYALRALLGSNIGSDIDQGFKDLADDIDAVMATDGQGVAASRPTSTSGSPGKSGRWYRSTDTGAVERDNGTGWNTVRPGRDEFILQTAALVYQGVLWRLAWVFKPGAATGVQGWYYVGGPFLRARANDGASVTGTTWTKLTSITVPRPGRYEVMFGARRAWNTNPGSGAELGVISHAAGGTPNEPSYNQYSAAGERAPASGVDEVDIATAGTDIDLVARSASAGVSAVFDGAYLLVRPLYVT
jgi:hypothetical protein